MNKTDIKSAVSIEFALSIGEAGRIVDIIFNVIEDCFRKNKNLEIQKFGKLNVITEKISENNKFKTLRYLPSKKLAKRVNYSFENLKKVKLELKEKEVDNSDKFDFKMPQEFIKQIRENKEEELNINLEDNIKPSTGTPTLISDNLIKLHKEITEAEEKELKKNNLWG